MRQCEGRDNFEKFNTCHKMVISLGDGAPARTRTWDPSVIEFGRSTDSYVSVFASDPAEISPMELVSKIQCWIMCDHVLELDYERLALVEIQLCTSRGQTEGRTHEVGCLVG
jgi:hypothetical protein